MVKPAQRPSDGLLLRVGAGVLVVLVAWFLIKIVLGWVFGIIRVALLLALLGIVAWVVLVGPPGSDDA